MTLAVIEEQLSTYKAQKSFYEFFKQAWVHIEGPHIPYVDNWHIKAICDHLQACYEGKIKYFVLNAPPRCAKSTIADVAFPAWVWTNKPHLKFIFGAHSNTLAVRDSIKFANLINSSWYQKRWGHLVILRKNTEDHVENTQKGYRIITTPTSRVTGQGADFLIGDDLNDMMEVRSDVKRDRVNEWFSSTFSSRVNNPKMSCIILHQQRGHQDDISGFILKRDYDKRWVHLMIPMEFELLRKCTTIAFNDDQKLWSDPRIQDGELMFGDWFDKDHLEGIKARLGAASYAGQYQQRPAPAEGAIIKRNWFKWWKDEHPPEIVSIIQSWDTAFSEKKEAAYSACTTWGVFYDDQTGLGNVILLSMWRDRVGFPELRDMAKRLYFDYRDKAKERNPNLRGRKVNRVIIESKATGDPLIRDLAKAGIYATSFNPNKYGDKLVRVHNITHLLEAGLVWLPARGPSFETLMPEASDFLEDILYFPNGESRDLVDTMSQALQHLYDSGILNHPKDPRDIPSYYDTQTASVY